MKLQHPHFLPRSADVEEIETKEFNLHHFVAKSTCKKVFIIPIDTHSELFNQLHCLVTAGNIVKPQHQVPSWPFKPNEGLRGSLLRLYGSNFDTDIDTSYI